MLMRFNDPERIAVRVNLMRLGQYPFLERGSNSE